MSQRAFSRQPSLVTFRAATPRARRIGAAPRLASGDMDAPAEPPSFALLPAPFLLAVLALLPVDSRARAACVSRAWRDAAAHASLWTEVDLTLVERMACTDYTFEDVLSALAPRLTQLRTLRLSTAPNNMRLVQPDDMARGLLRRVRGGQLPALRKLHFTCSTDLLKYPHCSRVNVHNLRWLLAEAPQVTQVEVDAFVLPQRRHY